MLWGLDFFLSLLFYTHCWLPPRTNFLVTAGGFHTLLFSFNQPTAAQSFVPTGSPPEPNLVTVTIGFPVAQTNRGYLLELKVVLVPPSDGQMAATNDAYLYRETVNGLPGYTKEKGTWFQLSLKQRKFLEMLNKSEVISPSMHWNMSLEKWLSAKKKKKKRQERLKRRKRWMI